MALIRPYSDEYADYVRDESRTQGHAETISFPTCEADVIDVLQQLGGSVPVTVQGARTGLAAGAVPFGGHIMNLSRMNHIKGLTRAEDGTYSVVVEPGVILSELRKCLANKSIPTTGWDEHSIKLLDEMYAGPARFFPTDPTEASAALGGIVACNASGARSYRYGPARGHVRGLRVLLSCGSMLVLQRGEVFAQGRSLDLTCEDGRQVHVDLPTYDMPHTKNASGLYVTDGLDAIDLFIGSDGTLGIICQATLDLLEVPAVTWGVSCFMADEAAALDFVVAARPRLTQAAAIEYFDAGALDILRAQRQAGAAFSALPKVPDHAGACVFVELDCDDEQSALAQLHEIGELLVSVGADEADTWVARTQIDRETLTFFRHAVPESVNMLIDERRKTDPSITKLGSDMSVPDERLHDVMALYRSTLAEAGLESATWGHIGNNHLHVNVLPRNAADHAAGKALFAQWAKQVSAMGGAVSAEHGVGKLKRDFLLSMYGPEHVAQMARCKHQLDEAAILGQGNLFATETSEQEA